MAVKHTFLFKGNTTKTKNLTSLSAIREKCLECSNWSSYEVDKCTCLDCALYPFRHGKNPGMKKRVLSDTQKKALTERLKSARENAHKSK